MIPKKYIPLLKQFTRYFGVALIGYAVDFTTLIVLKELLHVQYLVAASSGFILGLAVTYILSSKYVFGQSKFKSKYIEFGIFAAVGLVGLGLLNLLMWVMTGLFDVNYIVSKIIATVFVYLWNFFARRKFYHEEAVSF